MNSKRAILLSAILVWLCSPPAARGGDVESLKTAFEQDVKALTSLNLDMLMAATHEEIVLYGSSSPAPVEGKEAYRQYYQQAFANAESLSLTPHNPQFRVIGTTGIVWGLSTNATKLKNGSITTYAIRYIFTYAEVDGKWLRVAVHSSRPPTGN